MAGAPSDSEATIPAIEEEMQLMHYPRAIGNPTNMDLTDDDHLRENPRDVGNLSARIQYELGHNEGFQCKFAASGRSMSRQGRSASRRFWRRKYRADDDDEEWEDDARLARRGRTPGRSPNRARARSSGARFSGLQRPHPPDAGYPRTPSMAGQ
eukprot:6074075-Pyramimonas_sp.AAC.1